MTDSDETKRRLAELTARNVQIAGLLERLRSGRQTDETRARDAALQREFDANQAIISRLSTETR